MSGDGCHHSNRTNNTNSEPILMEGRDRMSILADGWTAVSADSKRAAQFEHTILITDNEPEILSPHR